MFDEELDKILRKLFAEWNVAERRIKKAEQVQGGQVVGSAIFELRYAGRKIVDAFTLAMEGNWKKEEKRYQEIREFFEDATEDCVKAKHDAIDAMLTFVAIWFDKIETELGLEGIVELFPSYIDSTAKIVEIQDKISDSRHDRHRSRNGIYDTIELDDFDEILALYQTMLTSKTRVMAMIARKTRQRRGEQAWIIGSTIVVVLALVVAIIK